MKTVTINRESWHFWLAELWAYRVAEPHDFCEYLRWVVLGATKALFFAALLAVLAGFCAWITGDFIGWVIAGVQHGFVEPVAAFGFIVAIAFGLFLGVLFGAQAAAPIVADHSPAFLRDAYWSLKDRICYLVLVR